MADVGNQPEVVVSDGAKITEDTDGEAIFKKLLLLDPSADKGDYFAEGSWDLDGLSEDLKLTSAKAQQADSFLSDTMDTSNDQTPKPDENDKPTENGETSPKFKSTQPEGGAKGVIPESAPAVESKPDPSVEGGSSAPTAPPSDGAPTEEKVISETAQVDSKNGPVDMNVDQASAPATDGTEKKEGEGESKPAVEEPKKEISGSQAAMLAICQAEGFEPESSEEEIAAVAAGGGEEEPAYEEPEGALYCICRKPYNEDEFMIACDKCNDWYHGSCIGVDENFSKRIDKYHCFRCEGKPDAKDGWCKLKPAKRKAAPSHFTRRHGAVEKRRRTRKDDEDYFPEQFYQQRTATHHDAASTRKHAAEQAASRAAAHQPAADQPEEAAQQTQQADEAGQREGAGQREARAVELAQQRQAMTQQYAQAVTTLQQQHAVVMQNRTVFAGQLQQYQDRMSVQPLTQQEMTHYQQIQQGFQTLNQQMQQLQGQMVQYNGVIQSIQQQTPEQFAVFLAQQQAQAEQKQQMEKSRQNTIMNIRRKAIAALMLVLNQTVLTSQKLELELYNTYSSQCTAWDDEVEFQKPVEEEMRSKMIDSLEPLNPAELKPGPHGNVYTAQVDQMVGRLDKYAELRDGALAPENGLDPAELVKMSNQSINDYVQFARNRVAFRKHFQSRLGEATGLQVEVALYNTFASSGLDIYQKRFQSLIAALSEELVEKLQTGAIAPEMFVRMDHQAATEALKNSTPQPQANSPNDTPKEATQPETTAAQVANSVTDSFLS
eukprot:463846_1